MRKNKLEMNETMLEQVNGGTYVETLTDIAFLYTYGGLKVEPTRVELIIGQLEDAYSKLGIEATLYSDNVTKNVYKITGIAAKQNEVFSHLKVHCTNK